MRISDWSSDVCSSDLSVSRSQTISGATAKLIDEEIRRIIEEAEEKARKVLTEHMDDLHRVSKALLEFETLSGDEVQTILDGGRSEEHTSELQSLMRISYAVFCLKKKIIKHA